MSAGLGGLTLGQQQQFLKQAGLQTLPDVKNLSEAQFTLLAGIVGEERAVALKGQKSPSGPSGAYNASSPSLPAPETSLTGGDFSNIMAKVAEMRAKIGELQAKVASEGVKQHKDDIATASKEEQKRIQESAAKLEKAAQSGKIGKIFGWIGAVVGGVAATVALVAAIAIAVATGGTATPLVIGAGAVMAVAVLGLTVMILQETGAMEAMLGKIADAVMEKPDIFRFLLPGPLGNMLADKIEKGEISRDNVMMALQIGVSAAMLVASLAAAGVSVVMTVASGGAAAGLAIAQVAQIVGMIGQIAGACCSIAGGSASIAQSVYSYEAAQLQADSKEMMAWLIRLQQMMEEESDRLKDILEQLNAGFTDASDAIAGIAQSNRAVIQNMGC
jgi:hypothetical protein